MAKAMPGASAPVGQDSMQRLHEMHFARSSWKRAPTSIALTGQARAQAPLRSQRPGS